VHIIRQHIKAMALAMLFALMGMQLAQAVHIQDHGPVLEQIDKCIACKIAAHIDTTDEPPEPVAPTVIFAEIPQPILQFDFQSQAYFRPPGRAPPLSHSI
jgi:hypothetical protein